MSIAVPCLRFYSWNLQYKGGGVHSISGFTWPKYVCIYMNINYDCVVYFSSAWSVKNAGLETSFLFLFTELGSSIDQMQPNIALNNSAIDKGLLFVLLKSS